MTVKYVFICVFAEYKLARDWIIENLSLTRDVEVQLFEITIRALGGLLSIYHLTEDDGFLTVAVSIIFFWLIIVIIIISIIIINNAQIIVKLSSLFLPITLYNV